LSSGRNRPVVPVVLDPLLAKKLRPHQVEGMRIRFPTSLVHQQVSGVKFMYECVMGMGKHEGQGKQKLLLS